MKILIYAGAELMTGDDIAEAVLEYCAALAESEAAETLDIPVVEPDGTIGRARLLLGPASQIVARSVESDWPELEDVPTVERVVARTMAQRPVIHVQARSPRDDDQNWADSI
ncbi:hypothetical protein [Microbacterium pygmaeum]|uniref:Uncharacterized protein n=1 Tax=Microbacterium pygmaeum TaxID=370764 RepID=A0A1G8DJZ2_9MICO|nr:hypothetical protein [Microbacterium pygmaeum]SDH57974.1 hypothetical protein SAMN04489810_3370 [Microbacterium pygmaeum]